MTTENKQFKYLTIILVFLPLLFSVSCSDNNKKVQTNTKSEAINDSINPIMLEEEKETIPQNLTEEDSTTFYNSISEEAKIIAKYCKCSKTKGSTNIDCKDYIKELSIQQKISDGIRNKYFNNSIVLEKLSKKTNELNKQFNDCSN